MVAHNGENQLTAQISKLHKTKQVNNMAHTLAEYNANTHSCSDNKLVCTEKERKHKPRTKPT